MLIEHYSSYYRLKKGLSWLLRVKRCLSKTPNATDTQTISVAELRQAEEILIKHVQQRHYAPEIKALKLEKLVSAQSSLRNLDPRLSASEVLVVGGRLKHAPISPYAMHPAILPPDDKLTKMIVLEKHQEAHLGTEWLLSMLRLRFWLPRARRLIKAIRYACVVCKKMYDPTHNQKMADLPAERLEPGGRCFTYTGLDLCGPFYVTQGRSKVKRYGCLFTCFTTRAVHMEVVTDLSTAAFLNGFFRFTARRGCPMKVFCDNGTNLVGGKRELSLSLRQLNRAEVVESARRKDIEWWFNTPTASHAAGVWERMVRTVRRVLCATLSPRCSLSDDVLQTAMINAENIVNSRPIAKLSDDVRDDAPITPNHLLMSQENASFPWGSFLTADLYRKSWRQAQVIIDQFWDKWKRAYILDLHRRSKWHQVTKNLEEGDLVLIEETDAPRGVWPLGRVVRVQPGRDGLVRSVVVKTRGTELMRPVTKLVPLECSSVWHDIA